MIEGPRHSSLMPDDLSSVEGITNLVHDLYWYPDDLYLLFFFFGEGIAASLNETLKTHGVAMKKTELYFYRHPNSAYKNNFIRVLPHSEAPEWQKEAARGQMFGRISLSLEPWRRKQLDLEQTAHATTRAIADSEPIVEMKLNLWGVGINLQSLLHRVKRWWNRGRKSN